MGSSDAQEHNSQEARQARIRALKDELLGENLLSTAEVAEILEVSARTVGDYIREGRLAAVQIGGGWKVPEEALRRYLSGQWPGQPPGGTSMMPAGGAPSRFKGLRSQPGLVIRTTFRLINQLDQTVNVYWIDFEGERRHYPHGTTLQPRQEFFTRTFLTHTWLVTDEEDRELALFAPDGQHRDVALTPEVLAAEPAVPGPWT